MDQLCAIKERFFSSLPGKVIQLGLSVYMIADMVTDAINTKKFADYAQGCIT